MAASEHVNTLPQCSPTSVGLAQARPNNLTLSRDYSNTHISRQAKYAIPHLA